MTSSPRPRPLTLTDVTDATQARILRASPQHRRNRPPIHDALVAEREAANRPGVWRRVATRLVDFAGTDHALWVLVGVAVAALALLPVFA